MLEEEDQLEDQGRNGQYRFWCRNRFKLNAQLNDDDDHKDTQTLRPSHPVQWVSATLSLEISTAGA